MSATQSLGLVALCATCGLSLCAQAPVRGTVVDAQRGAPLPGALVAARTAARAATTDRLGRFVIWIGAFPDTLVIAQIGRAAERVALDSAPRSALQIRLTSTPITLSDVIVTAPQGAARPVEDVGRWQVPLAAARAMPAGIETDVLRSLALVPAVTFSSPLSARPIIRGYDAGESSLRIDGFEVLNLYHIGRVFSAFPADAASEVSVITAPASASAGGTLAGTVDIAGQVGDPEGGLHGGADLSLVSGTAWAGGGSEATRLFAAARAAHLSLVGSAAGYAVAYGFRDFYAKTLISRRGRPAATITAFASSDNLGRRQAGTGMDWGNLLLGGRWQAIDDGRRSLNLWASANQFAEDVSNVRVRYSSIDVRNRFARVGTGADAAVQGATSRLAFGVSLARRSIGNRIQPVFSSTEFASTDARFRFTELGLYAEGMTTIAGATLQLGGRLDAAGGVSVLQPRARLALPLARDVSLGVALGRTSRMFHLVTDPQAEPELAFYDFWLNAGKGGVPVPTIDHATVDLDVVRGPIAARLSLFGSRARGLVELRPESDQRAEAIAPFRYGRGRGAGLELQLGLRSEGSRALSVAYVFGVAQRNWGQGWVPWSQDRRHMIRIIARTGLGSHWSVGGTFEALSGPPLTPVNGVFTTGFLGPSGFDPNYYSLGAYSYGPENSARSAGTARCDLGFRYLFKGPWRSRAALGISVINAGFGPVAPLRPAPLRGYGPGDPPRVTYERLFDLPAVPTLTLRVEF